MIIHKISGEGSNARVPRNDETSPRIELPVKLGFSSELHRKLVRKRARWELARRLASSPINFVQPGSVNLAAGISTRSKFLTVNNGLGGKEGSENTRETLKNQAGRRFVVSRLQIDQTLVRAKDEIEEGFGIEKSVAVSFPFRVQHKDRRLAKLGEPYQKPNHFPLVPFEDLCTLLAFDLKCVSVSFRDFPNILYMTRFFKF